MTDHPDAGWLGLEDLGDGRFSFELRDSVARLDGKFYGGTGVALTVAAMEATSGRSASWTTVQFVGSADLGERLDISVDVLAAGGRTSQLRVSGAVAGRSVFEALGSAVDRREGGFEAQFGDMPDGGEPGSGIDWATRLPFAVPAGRPGWLSITEMSLVDLPEGGLGLWARMLDQPLTRAGLGFLADCVPMGIMRASGRAGFGTSLDNAIRYLATPRGEWVLIQLDPHGLSGGYGHGAARLWATDGTLLAIASQTATMRLID